MLSSIIIFAGWFAVIKFILSHYKYFYQGFKHYILKHKVDLKQKYGEWAVISGATDGIGKAYSLALARKGLKIVLVSRNPDKLKSVAEEIKKKYYVEVKTIAVDFGRMDIYDCVKKELCDLDVGVLVNNVGVQYHHPMYLAEVPEDELKEMININISSMLMLSHIVLPEMMRRRRGCVINMSSGSNMNPLPFMNVYAASKVFGRYFSEALRQEYSKYNITVQTVAPFYVSTKINHFSGTLRSINVFIPHPETFAVSAVDTVGVMDHTTGYFPHSLQYYLVAMIPTPIAVFFGGLMYKQFRGIYLKKQREKAA